MIGVEELVQIRDFLSGLNNNSVHLAGGDARVVVYDIAGEPMQFTVFYDEGRNYHFVKML